MHALKRAAIIGLLTSSIGACAHAAGVTPAAMPKSPSTALQAANIATGQSAADLEVISTLSGGASWYGPGFNGKKAASGEIFSENASTAAHRTLPFNTWVRVTNLANHKSTMVRINDRGPFHGKRIIDLSKKAATEIGMQDSGVANVRVEVLAAPLSALMAYQ